MENLSHTSEIQPCMNNQRWLLISCCIFPHQAELQEVVGEGEADDPVTVSSPSSDTAESSQAEAPESPPLQVQCTLLALCQHCN